jgi:hypothetical protein
MSSRHTFPRLLLCEHSHSLLGGIDGVTRKEAQRKSVDHVTECRGMMIKVGLWGTIACKGPQGSDAMSSLFA